MRQSFIILHNFREYTSSDANSLFENYLNILKAKKIRFDNI